jgi:hypothetical protein
VDVIARIVQTAEALAGRRLQLPVVFIEFGNGLGQFALERLSLAIDPVDLVLLDEPAASFNGKLIDFHCDTARLRIEVTALYFGYRVLISRLPSDSTSPSAPKASAFCWVVNDLRTP